MNAKRKRLKGRLRKGITGMVLALCMAVNCMPVCAADTQAASGPDDERKTVRVGYYRDNDAFQSGYRDDERKSGYAYEYYQELSRYTGWIYQYEYGSWDEIYAKLLNGEVDIMAGVSKFENHESEVLFPEYAMGEQTYHIFMTQEDAHRAADNVSLLDGARLGVKSNSCMPDLLQQFADANNIECEAVAYDSLEERLSELENKHLDGIVTVENDRVKGLFPAFNIGTSEFYFAVNKNRPDILEELNAAQEEILSGSPYYISRLQDTYFNSYVSAQELTEKEQAWLQAHPQLRVGYLKNYMPFCGGSDDGREPRGLLADLLEELSNYTGVQFLSAGYDDYGKMIQDMENGEIDMVFPTLGDIWYSESQNYTQTVSVASSRMCVVYKGEYRADIYKRVAVSEGSPLQAYYLTINYPESEQVTYRDWDECMAAVRSGEVGCMLLNSDLLYRYMNEHKEFSNLNVAELEDMIDFCFAVRRGNSSLYSILNKGIHNIDETVIKDSLIQNSYVEPEYTLMDFVVNHIVTVLALIGAFVLLLIVFFFLYRNRVMRDRKMMQDAYDRERDYIADKEENFDIIGSLIRIYVSTYYISLTDREYQVITDLELKRERAEYVSVGKEGLSNWINTDVKELYRERFASFLNLDTLSERIRTADSLSMEYETVSQGWCRGSFIPVARNEQGRLTHVIFAVQEINQEKKAQEQAQTALQDAYEAANRANQAKSDFLARMSHDIRTPMNAIIGMTAIAEAHINDTVRVGDCLRKITASGRHLLTLINEVLDMSKIEAGRMQIVEEEFNLQELIDNLLAMMQPQIEGRNHELKVSVRDLVHENVIGDSPHIQQVFVNIMGNAVKYTPPGGVISLTVTEKPNNPRIGCYEFIFEDNGIGMAPEFLEHIYEPFSRENETNENKVQGTGLGLSIVFNIVKMMGGDIRVESKQGKGSRFIVMLYLRLQEDVEVSTEDLAGLPVLVVDDMQDSCESTCMVLNDLGMKGEWVLSGREAVERVRSANTDYSAFVLDWKMPDMDGVATAKAIRELVGSTVPIIILSGHDWSEIETEARAAGVNAFIGKPLSKSGVTTLFKRLINGEVTANENPLGQIEGNEFEGKRLLLVEDNDINAEIATEILEWTGADVEHVWNGREAVDKLMDSEPGYFDLVFMDIQMPVMDGYAATRAIRASDREDLKRLPIIAMTANAFAEDIQAAAQAGMNQHIAKPLDIRQIMTVLQKWLVNL